LHDVDAVLNDLASRDVDQPDRAAVQSGFDATGFDWTSRELDLMYLARSCVNQVMTT
jgi:hypothetical protein